MVHLASIQRVHPQEDEDDCIRLLAAISGVKTFGTLTQLPLVRVQLRTQRAFSSSLTSKNEVIPLK